MFEQRTCSEAIEVSPNMRGICRGSSEVGGGVDVGISFEENITVARFYWLPAFKSPTATSSISAFKAPETTRNRRANLAYTQVPQRLTVTRF